jgi:hypothetical protein
MLYSQWAGRSMKPNAIALLRDERAQISMDGISRHCALPRLNCSVSAVSAPLISMVPLRCWRSEFRSDVSEGDLSV